MNKLLATVVGLAVLITAFVVVNRVVNRDYISPSKNIDITTKAFVDGGMMPTKYTGLGEDLSPPLELGKVAKDAKTIAIIMDDLDHPLGMYNHWVIWNIPSEFTKIPEGITKGTVVKELGGAIQGKSAYGGKHYYRGPLPPFGTHRYIFKVYILDTEINLKFDASKVDLQKAIDGHILQFGTITGKFRK